MPALGNRSRAVGAVDEAELSALHIFVRAPIIALRMSSSSASCALGRKAGSLARHRRDNVVTKVGIPAFGGQVCRCSHDLEGATQCVLGSGSADPVEQFVAAVEDVSPCQFLPGWVPILHRQTHGHDVEPEPSPGVADESEVLTRTASWAPATLAGSTTEV